MNDRLAPCLALLLILAMASPLIADDSLSHLDFEECDPSLGMAPWTGGPPGTLGLAEDVVRTGQYAGRIIRDVDSPQEFSSLSTSVPAEIAGQQVEIVGWVRTEDVDGWAGLWLREDGPSGSVQFMNMHQDGLSGSNDWTECRLELPLDAEAERIVFGVILAGTGQVWVDDMKLLIDGRPYADAPVKVTAPTALDLDQEFDEGSGLTLQCIEPWQVEPLVTLGKVWGFLKYHHPRVTGGERHWDYDLFRGLTTVLAASEAGAAQEAVASWALSLGEPAPCSPCAESPAVDAHLQSELGWLDDTARLGEDLAAYLKRVHAARAVGSQFYVESHVGVGNPKFLHEDSYSQFEFPDAGYRLLALFRLWNIIDNWFPYRDVMGENWDAVLAEFVPRFVKCRTHELYDRELLALITRVNDTHANLWSHVFARPPYGDCQLPVAVRFVDDQAVVWRYLDPIGGLMSRLIPGDVIEAVDGTSVDELVAEWAPYYAASNEPTRRRDMGRALTIGIEGPCRLKILRDGVRMEVDSKRSRRTAFNHRLLHDREGPAFQILPSGIAYLKLSEVNAGHCRDYIAKAMDTPGFIIDIRNYPSNFVPFALGGHLVAEPTDFVRFTTADLSNPGTFTWTDPLTIEPLEPHFEGPVAILVDESSQSQAEYTAMALRTAPDAVVIGSTTAGADGDVSKIPLPGGRSSMISGIGIFYPDKTPTQRVGIVPDLEVVPTVAGFRDGRDEVLEAAVQHILDR